MFIRARKYRALCNRLQILEHSLLEYSGKNDEAICGILESVEELQGLIGDAEISVSDTEARMSERIDGTILALFSEFGDMNRRISDFEEASEGLESARKEEAAYLLGLQNVFGYNAVSGVTYGDKKQ